MPIFDTPFTFELTTTTSFRSGKQMIPSSVKLTHISLGDRKGGGANHHVTVMVKSGPFCKKAVALARLQRGVCNQVTNVQASIDLTEQTEIFIRSEDRTSSVVLLGVQYTDVSEEQIGVICRE